MILSSLALAIVGISCLPTILFFCCCSCCCCCFYAHIYIFILFMYVNFPFSFFTVNLRNKMTKRALSSRTSWTRNTTAARCRTRTCRIPNKAPTLCPSTWSLTVPAAGTCPSGTPQQFSVPQGSSSVSASGAIWESPLSKWFLTRPTV